MTDLGIWIPTWNRPHFFARLIASLEPQHDDVHVNVGVNPPSDGYEFPDWCQVTFNETNIGQSRNILQGVTTSDADYLWMLGDDEQLLPGAVEEIRRCIATAPGMVICTDGRFDHGPSGYFPTWPDWMDACLDAGREVMLTVQTLMSATVFRRAALNLDVAHQFLDTRYGHHFGMLEGLLQEPVVVTSQPVFISGRAEDSSVHVEPDDYRANHYHVTSSALTYMIQFVNERAGRNYPASCYQPGVGFDGRT